ncbi:hypothetical protein F5Y03DRAFT_392163 [Xylaria venustula]|nr:hypothetical protein F5Y03DRAFT_392163 [Xylaria venustula]
MDSMNWRQKTGEQPRCSASFRPTPKPDWQPGDIAFLKKAEEFSAAEQNEVLERGGVHIGATGHPVIILGRSNDSRGYTVTTVSAYKSGEENDYLPPWKQAIHYKKDADGFRAFEGSARPNNKFQHLYLEGGKLWPKPKTSWVYIHTRYTVPPSTLVRYNKTKSQLRMTRESLQDLLRHIHTTSKGSRGRTTAKSANWEPNKRITMTAQPKWNRDSKENLQPVSSCKLISHGLDNTGRKPLWSVVVTKPRSENTLRPLNLQTVVASSVEQC